MANTIIIKNSTTPGSVPGTGDVNVGELALNVADRKMYTKNSGGSVVQVGGGATGAGTDDIFYENGQTVTSNYTITSGKNAMSTGAITINSGVTVTVPSGSRWVII
jgi:hypothetical protein